jgi:hypothetical protein
VVLAHASPSERNPAPAFVIVSRTFKRSRVDRQPVEAGYKQGVAIAKGA